MEHPERYGFYVDESQRYAPMDQYRTITIDHGIADLSAYALEQGTTYRHLKLYNPWLLGNTLTNKTGKSYEIRVPHNG